MQCAWCEKEEVRVWCVRPQMTPRLAMLNANIFFFFCFQPCTDGFFLLIVLWLEHFLSIVFHACCVKTNSIWANSQKKKKLRKLINFCSNIMNVYFVLFHASGNQLSITFLSVVIWYGGARVSFFSFVTHNNYNEKYSMMQLKQIPSVWLCITEYGCEYVWGYDESIVRSCTSIVLYLQCVRVYDVYMKPSKIVHLAKVWNDTHSVDANQICSSLLYFIFISHTFFLVSVLRGWRARSALIVVDHLTYPSMFSVCVCSANTRYI